MRKGEKGGGMDLNPSFDR